MQSMNISYRLRFFRSTQEAGTNPEDRSFLKDENTNLKLRINASRRPINKRHEETTSFEEKDII